MSNITVSYAEIEHAAAQLGQGKEELDAKLRALRQQIQHLVTSGFVTDQASVKFQAAYEAYTANAQGVVAQLSEMQLFLSRSAGVMQELDARIAASIV